MKEDSVLKVGRKTMLSCNAASKSAMEVKERYVEGKGKNNE